MTFHASLPNLQRWPLMDIDFVIGGLLVWPVLPHYSIFVHQGTYSLSLLSDFVSRLSPCESLALHPHQVVQRTFTFKPLFMLGTPPRTIVATSPQLGKRGKILTRGLYRASINLQYFILEKRGIIPRLS